MLKSANQIKDQLIFWYLKYHGTKLEEITGAEKFTIFDQIPSDEKKDILQRITLNAYELPVMVTRIEPLHWILNTTEQFIRIHDHVIERIAYKDFYWHEGVTMGKVTKAELFAMKFGIGKKPINPKVEGAIMPFGLQLNNQTVIYWPMPTGAPMFGFWNVTKKCNLIGRKYEIQEY